jgi:hypothetical protein
MESSAGVCALAGAVKASAETQARLARIVFMVMSSLLVF